MNQRGLTLIELLIALVMSGIIAEATYLMFTSNQRIYTIQDETINIEQTLRPVVEYIGRHIRLAGLDPEGVHLFGFHNATNATQIDFSFDLDHDGVLATGERKAFRVINSQLQEYSFSLNQWETIAENIDALNFTYLDSTGSLTNVTNKIKTVQLALVGRSRGHVPKYIDSQSYQNIQGVTILLPQNDNRIRQVITDSINCRNIGL